MPFPKKATDEDLLKSYERPPVKNRHPINHHCSETRQNIKSMKDRICIEELKAALSYDPETGIFRWRIKTRNTESDQIAGTLQSNGYRQIRVNRKSFYAHRLAWAFIHGEFPEIKADHINGIRDDNRISNIRSVDNFGNGRNHARSVRNKTGVKGVSWSRRYQKFVAQLRFNGKQNLIGRYSTLQAAAEAVRDSRERNHGQFCNHGEILTPYKA